MKLTITKVYRSTTDKNGKPLIARGSGKPYEKVAIKTQEYGESWISGFGGAWNKNWKEGDTVDIVIKKEAGKDGKDYYNFERPAMPDANDMLNRILKLEAAVFGAKAEAKAPVEEPENPYDLGEF